MQAVIIAVILSLQLESCIIIANIQKYFRFHVKGRCHKHPEGGEGGSLYWIFNPSRILRKSLRLYFSSKKSLRKSLRLYFSSKKSLRKSLRLYFSSKKSLRKSLRLYFSSKRSLRKSLRVKIYPLPSPIGYRGENSLIKYLTTPDTKKYTSIKHP